MAFARARAARALQSPLRSRLSNPGRTSLPQLVQAGQRRWQSGGGHGDHQASSDLPWAIGAVVVTVPSAYYLWPPAKSAHHDDHHDAHGGHQEHSEASEEKEEEAPAEEQAPAEDAGGEDAGSKEEPADSGDGAKEEQAGSDKAEESKAGDEPADDSKKSSEGGEGGNEGSKTAPQFKGKMVPDADGQSDTRKSEPSPPSRGTMTKRIDSGYQKNLDGSSALDNEEKSPNDTTGEQAGTAKTHAKHSLQIDQDSEKSKKGEGIPETAKLSGTVDPSRPAR